MKNYICFTIDLLGTAPYISSYFGAGTGSIALRDLRCTGNEARLIDCPSTPVSICSHTEDSGVRCQARTGIIMACYTDQNRSLAYVATIQIKGILK